LYGRGHGREQFTHLSPYKPLRQAAENPQRRRIRRRRRRRRRSNNAMAYHLSPGKF